MCVALYKAEVWQVNLVEARHNKRLRRVDRSVVKLYQVWLPPGPSVPVFAVAQGLVRPALVLLLGTMITFYSEMYACSIARPDLFVSGWICECVSEMCLLFECVFGNL